MADAFGDDLFNVFDEDSSANRPTPSEDIAQITEESSNAPEDDSGKRYIVMYRYPKPKVDFFSFLNYFAASKLNFILKYK